MHQVSRHWQNQCLQIVSIHQTLESSDLQGGTQSMKQILPSATNESTIPEFTIKILKSRTILTARNCTVSNILENHEKVTVKQNDIQPNLDSLPLSP